MQVAVLERAAAAEAEKEVKKDVQIKRSAAKQAALDREFATLKKSMNDTIQSMLSGTVQTPEARKLASAVGKRLKQLERQGK